MVSEKDRNLRSLPIVIDVEASGFGRGSYPIEIGFVLPDGTPHCTLIRPSDAWTHWDPAAEALHGIPREVLFSRGKSCQDVACWLNRHLHGQTVYSDAWGHDLSWLGRLFDEAETPQLFHLDSLLALLTEEQIRRWGEIHRTVIHHSTVPRHRASNDARLIQMAYGLTIANVPPEAIPGALASGGSPARLAGG